jgi:hypothetical protein
MEDIDIQQLTNELEKIKAFTSTIPSNKSWDDYLSTMESPLQKASVCIQTANAIHRLLACNLF